MPCRKCGLVDSELLKGKHEGGHRQFCLCPSCGARNLVQVRSVDDLERSGSSGCGDNPEDSGCGDDWECQGCCGKLYEIHITKKEDE